MSKPDEYVDVEPEVLEAEEARPRILEKARRLAGKLPLARDVVAAVYAMGDPSVPMFQRGLLAGALLYFLLPMDAIPDFLGLIGFTDDAAVLMAALKAVGAMVSETHYARADAFLFREQEA